MCKIDFQDGSILGFQIGTILATCDPQVAPIFPTKFQVNWPFGSGEETPGPRNITKHVGSMDIDSRIPVFAITDWP